MLVVKRAKFPPIAVLLLWTATFTLTGTHKAVQKTICDQQTFQQECTEKDPYLVKEYNVRGYTSISAFTPGGDIQVLPSDDPHKVRIELYVNQGFYGWLFGTNLKNYRITNVRRDHEIISSVEKKSKERSSFWDSQTTFSYKIFAPIAASTNLKTLGGSIHIKGFKGKQLLKSSGGNITATEISGLVKAYTSGGNVEIYDSKGTLYAHTNGGNISVHDCMGEMRLKTNGGKISGWNISGSMIAQVDGGDIEAQFEKISHGVNLTTGSGNILVKVPDSDGYSLFVEGSTIQLEESVPFRGHRTNRMMEGKLNGGGVPLHLVTNSGTVTLEILK